MNCALEIVNSIEEKGRKFLKHSNINGYSYQNFCEVTITINFPWKQTIMKHDMNKFNLTQFEWRIQNLINLLVNKKKLDAFLLLQSF